MLIVHQTGSVKVAEVVRYTLTYTPSLDRILPPPTHLHVKIRNTSAVPLRAAYLHGPYTLYVACYPLTFNPHEKQENCEQEGEPQFEPQLKAGGHWLAKLIVPEEVREDAERSFYRSEEAQRKSFTWVIEVASQILFSTTAAVHFEVLVGRDEKSVHLGFHGVVGSGQGAPGRLEDHQQGRSRNAAHPKGVFSKAVKLVVEDTESLWNTPPFPSFDEEGSVNAPEQPQNLGTGDPEKKANKSIQKPKKIHLVLLTHGLHSNLGADMLFLKESIDAAAKQAREDAKKRKSDIKAKKAVEENDFGRAAIGGKSKTMPDISVTPTPSDAGDDTDNEEDDKNDYDPDDEEVVVRGFSGNAVKTEKGIQYLGKRLAKFVLSITYPDQPYLPVKSSISRTITRSLTGQKLTDSDGKKPIHKGSSIVKDEEHTNHNLPYKITSISFIGHSLGGLTMTYAIAYIQKHSPEFFDRIKPINFVAMASPFLGLSNENPMYVKFALDFGLVGRTGQDLGLTWRAPAVVKSGWGAMISGFQTDASNSQKSPDPGSKPLLRILPTGPAHAALKRFRNRTVYSNVVNDGIVPLRTSCLLFLDWRGLGRVEKARRQDGLVGTMVGWGWAEMTGQNASAVRKPLAWNDLFGDSDSEAPAAGKKSNDPASSVPQADASQGLDDEETQNKPQQLNDKPLQDEVYGDQKSSEKQETPGLWAGLVSLFKPQAGSKSPKAQKIYKRGQAKLQNAMSDDEGKSRTASPKSSEDHHKPGIVRGSSLYTNTSENGEIEAPPRTTFFESAGDLLSPPLPPKAFILDPSARPRTIFHDRVYHPDDIPPPPIKRQRTFMRRTSSRGDDVPNQAHSDMSNVSSHPPVSTEEGTMKIEEKIARAYHKDMSWRKVLVRLEPDAHNNMIVRRMFANAYGWPVVKHMCDTHFAYTAAARTADADEAPEERARQPGTEIKGQGEEVKGQVDLPHESTHDPKGKLPDRAKTMDDVDRMPDDPDAVKKDLERLRSTTQAPNKSNRETRSPSEIRESRDEVSDLVSMVSATGQTAGINHGGLNSSRALLHSLARRDSARWSDRFFDSDAEDDEDEEDNAAFLLELQKARARGEHITEEQMQFAKKLSTSPRMSKIPSKSNTSLRSNVSGTTTGSTDQPFSPPKKLLSDPTKPVVAEPASMLPAERDTVKAQAAKEKASYPADPQTLDSGSGDSGTNVGEDLQQSRSLTEVGLGKSVEDLVVPQLPKDDKPGLPGVAEQVAIARGKNT